MKHNRIIFFITLMLACAAAQAQMPIRVGVRGGVNYSNITETRLTIGSIVDHAKIWKPGFTLGAIVDIPMGKNFYLSPGFYYDYRHDEYEVNSYSATVPGKGNEPMLITTTGSVTTSWFHIPMLISFRIPVTFVEFQFDFGPYVSMGLGGKDKFETEIFDGTEYTETQIISKDTFGKDGRYINVDWGFDMGVGLLFAHHYYIGAHYLIGARNLAQDREAVTSAHNHEWQFTIGYNF